MENNEKFTYTYSAPTEAERREIESIRRQYQAQPTTENKVERLRHLHARVITPATAVSIAVGVVGTLIFGGGLTMILELNILLLGILILSLGAVVAALSYPIYKLILKKQKKKYAEEILRLSDELLG